MVASNSGLFDRGEQSIRGKLSLSISASVRYGKQIKSDDEVDVLAELVVTVKVSYSPNKELSCQFAEEFSCSRKEDCSSLSHDEQVKNAGDKYSRNSSASGVWKKSKKILNKYLRAMLPNYTRREMM